MLGTVWLGADATTVPDLTTVDVVPLARQMLTLGYVIAAERTDSVTREPDRESESPVSEADWAALLVTGSSPIEGTPFSEVLSYPPSVSVKFVVCPVSEVGVLEPVKGTSGVRECESGVCVGGGRIADGEALGY